MCETEEIMEEVLAERAGVWEALATGSTAIEREVAAILRSIVAEIDGPEPANRASLRSALEWCLDALRVGNRTAQTVKVCVPYDGDQGLTDSSTWPTCICGTTAICPVHGSFSPTRRW